MATARGMSTVEANARGLPVSAHSAATNSSKRRSIPSAIRCSNRDRSVGLHTAHGPRRASRAARTARSTTSRDACGTSCGNTPGDRIDERERNAGRVEPASYVMPYG